MDVLNWKISHDGKLESMTLRQRPEPGGPPRYHILMRNSHTGEFAYEIYEGDNAEAPAYQNLTARRSAR
jgi:hypothetical protein